MLPEHILQQRFGPYVHSFSVEEIIDPSTVTKEDIMLVDVAVPVRHGGQEQVRP